MGGRYQRIGCKILRLLRLLDLRNTVTPKVALPINVGRNKGNKFGKSGSKHCAQNERFVTIAAYSGILLQYVRIAACDMANFELCTVGVK